MKTILVYAGTTEGRELVEILDRSDISCHVCVATEYGSQVLKTSKNVTIHEGRLDVDGMKTLIRQIKCDIVVDATHPYAVLVSKQIRESIENTDITYIRLLRDCNTHAEYSDTSYYESVEQCAIALVNTVGNILLTTGSKQLSEFTGISDLKKRIVARVIPGLESLKLCYDAGLEGKQIVAMQGPFSAEMNESIIREYNISHLVTKESGDVGGFSGKILAAHNQGIKLHVIRRPEEWNSTLEEDGVYIGEVVSILESMIGVNLARGRIEVVLAGLGPGSTGLMTKEVEKSIRTADVICGAKRVIESVETSAEKYPYYLKEDVIPLIQKISRERYTDIKVVVLFSGDTGFYSGCKKMYDALASMKDWKVTIMPGISSVSELSARFGIDWQDGEIVSLHGVSEDIWMPRLVDKVRHYKKTFFITSGVSDIRRIGCLLSDLSGEYLVKLGYNLSYNDEKLLTLTPSECMELDVEGLYTGVIEARELSHKFLVPMLGDDFFIRDKVPMTKEAIRKLSICQMKIKEGDIVYDIGSGSGSIAVQIGAMSSKVKVYALECNPIAVALINKNIKKANIFNVTVIETMAPNGMDKLEAADVAFIGGSKGNLREIISKLYLINPRMRVVLNAVSMETICEMYQILGTMNVKNTSIEQISVNSVQEIGNYNMISANNPVFIFAWDFVGDR